MLLLSQFTNFSYRDWKNFHVVPKEKQRCPGLLGPSLERPIPAFTLPPTYQLKRKEKKKIEAGIIFYNIQKVFDVTHYQNEHFFYG